jgi:GxxExxY protein
MLLEHSLTQEIIGAAIEVHQALGSGLLESAHERCLCHELSLRSIPFRRQVELPVHGGRRVAVARTAYPAASGSTPVSLALSS